MKRFLVVAVAVTLGTLAVVSSTRGEDSAEVRAQFAQPSRDYSSGPLWTWNDMLTEEQLTSSLEDLAGQHVKQVFVHPRPGLMTPYLSDDWFRLWKHSLKEAERLSSLHRGISLKDSLTGFFNRMFLNSELERLAKDIQRFHPLSILTASIDGLNLVNGPAKP